MSTTTTIDAAGTTVSDPLQETARHAVAMAGTGQVVHQQHQPATGAGMLMRIIETAAMRPDMDLARINGLIDVYERWQRREAENAYNAAFAAFKAEGVHVIRNRTIKDGPLKGKSYADAYAWVDGISEAMSRHGLSFSWQILEDARDWIRVECRVRHVLGHSEAVPFGGPPDEGGAKNKMHARASTLSYLERYTLKAVTGLAEEDDEADDDAGADRMRTEDRRRGPPDTPPEPPPPPVAPPEYTDEEFAEKLPPWVDQLTIPNEKSGKCIAPERLIAFIESKGKRFTQAQKEKLTSYKPPF
jgi:hypothetical protein